MEEESEGMRLRDRGKIKQPSRFQDFAMITLDEDLKYTEALQQKKWRKAMEDELNALKENGTWELTDLPQDKKAINNKWVFKQKPNNLYKARLVAKGCSQKYGLDYMETYSPVAQFKSIRLIFGVVATNKMKLAQFDVKTAFLNGDLQEEIYMVQPPGYEDGTERVCRLNKAIYGLKQAPRNWNKKFVNVLQEFGLEQSRNDPCVFFRNNQIKLVLVIYVDDGLIASNNEKEIENLLEHLNKNFDMKQEPVQNYLGIEIRLKRTGKIFIKQEKYINKILEKFNMKECKPVSTPGPTKSLENLNDKPTRAPYREAIGSLLFLASVSRPDIAFATNLLSRHMENPSESHWEMIKRIFRYLKGTQDYGLVFDEDLEGVRMTGYSDADFAGDVEIRKSTSGFVLTYNNTPISWYSKKQSVVALSTAEAEYVAAVEAIKEMIIVTRLGEELEICQNPYLLKVDNQSAIKMLKDETSQKRTKHMDVRFRFLEEKLLNEFKVEYIETEEQLADIFTKPLSSTRFEKLRRNLNIKQEGVLK